MLARLPLVLVGWYEEKQQLKVVLFQGYKEKADVPFCVFRVALMVCTGFGHAHSMSALVFFLTQICELSVTLCQHLLPCDVVLQARANGGELPGIYAASVHVDLNLGLIGRALYKVCSEVTSLCPQLFMLSLWGQVFRSLHWH